MRSSVLVRYGTISEVARFVNASGVPLRRGQPVVVRTHRGIELATLLEETTATESASDSSDFQIVRAATDEDQDAAVSLRTDCEGQFPIWQRRLDEWKLQLELVDLERTLDKSKLILYVLNERGPDCTRLALQAAAAGLGIIEVQPVGPEGLVPLAPSGGCGTGGGCGSGGQSGGCCH
jgi:cell fate regulator YaaT (PSP1 superfamily)